MPYFYFSRKSYNRKEVFFAELPTKLYKVEYFPAKLPGESSSSSSSSGTIPNKGENSFNTFVSNYENLPENLRICLDYCSILSMTREIERDRLVRLLLAEGLIPETTDELMEDLVEQVIDELIELGMLQEYLYADNLRVPGIYQDLCLLKESEEEFVSKALNSSISIRVVIDDDGKNNPPDFRKLEIASLFVITAARRGLSSVEDQGLSQAYLETVCGVQSLRVLDLNGEIENLPDKVGDLVLLKYLGVGCSYLKKLPRTLQNLQKLQTLDIRFNNLKEIPEEVLNLRQLRHLLTDSCRAAKGLGNMTSLQICHGLSARYGIASELGKLVQLRQLCVIHVSEDNSSELFSAIRMMENLVSLSLEADATYFPGLEGVSEFLPDMEEFSPPGLLKKVHLSGTLLEFPNWIASLENLTSLQFSFSNLMDYPTAFQFLPNLKHLVLWQACKAKCIYEEFCQAGGFPNLETLTINSMSLIEWIDIVPGAFPSLRCLRLWNCSRLKFLPDSLQNIASLQELILFATQEDLIRRLTGEENYKIKHIPKVITF